MKMPDGCGTQARSARNSIADKWIRKAESQRVFRSHRKQKKKDTSIAIANDSHLRFVRPQVHIDRGGLRGRGQRWQQAYHQSGDLNYP